MNNHAQVQAKAAVLSVFAASKRHWGIGAAWLPHVAAWREKSGLGVAFVRVEEQTFANGSPSRDAERV